MPQAKSQVAFGPATTRLVPDSPAAVTLPHPGAGKATGTALTPQAATNSAAAAAAAKALLTAAGTSTTAGLFEPAAVAVKTSTVAEAQGRDFGSSGERRSHSSEDMLRYISFGSRCCYAFP